MDVSASHVGVFSLLLLLLLLMMDAVGTWTKILKPGGGNDT